MKTEKNILMAFVLNLVFAILELFGGILTGSVAIVSDAIHDTGDAAGIGISYFLEKKSRRQPDDRYTYGYARYSVIGSFITTAMLLVGSAAVVYHAVRRTFEPTEINYDGMIILATVGVLVNVCAALLTREGGSLNQRAVNLHMLEDALGWIVTLIGAVVMKFTLFPIIDPIMSIAVAVFILVNAVKNLRETADLFLEKAPRDIKIEEIKAHLCKIGGVIDVHHIHVWSMDGQRHYATMHLVVSGDFARIKHAVREELAEHGIAHATLELEEEGEACQDIVCRVDAKDTFEIKHCH